MSGKITITITTGPKAGAVFVFEEHDTLLLGRKKDCQVCLSEDTLVSRHHFILEMSPPDIRIRDLGSLHGTYINGQKYGGREKHETPDEGARRKISQVDLHDGDEIKAGQTTLRVRVEGAASPLESVYCLMCYERISIESGEGRQDDNICVACQMQAQDDPGAFLFSLSKRSHSLTQKGSNIADYQIIQELGGGGMGVVYLAQHIKDGKQVALKIMRSNVAVNEHSRQRFLREMDATCALRHPNIITFLDRGTHYQTSPEPW